MSFQVDNCCGCTGTAAPTASMGARFWWPGWPPFTDVFVFGGESTSGVRYRTFTTRVYWQGNHPDGTVSFIEVDYTLSCDALDGSFLSDPATGVAVPAPVLIEDGTAWVLQQFPSVDSWAANGIVITATKLSIPAQTVLGGPGGPVTYPEIYIELSDPVTLSDCKTNAAALLAGTGGVDSIACGQSKEVTWMQGPELRMPHTMTDFSTATYMQLGTFTAIDPSPNPGTFYCWVTITELATDGGGTPFYPALITARDALDSGGFALGYTEPWPFAHNPQVVDMYDVDDFGAAIQFYSQLTYWVLNEEKWCDVTESACVTTTHLTVLGSAAPADECVIQAPVVVAGHSNLKLIPEDIAADTSHFYNWASSTPQFGYVLTGSGCPCVSP